MTIIQFEAAALHREISQLLGSREKVSGPRSLMSMILAASTASAGTRMMCRRLADQYLSDGLINKRDHLLLFDILDQLSVANSEYGEAE